MRVCPHHPSQTTADLDDRDFCPKCRAGEPSERYDANGGMIFRDCKLCGTQCDPDSLSDTGTCWPCVRGRADGGASRDTFSAIEQDEVDRYAYERATQQPAPGSYAEYAAEPAPPDRRDFLRERITLGGSFILDIPIDPVPLWGIGRDVLWAEGESLLIVGPQGTGKSTLGQQLALGRAGIPEYADLLGFPVTPGSRRVLYLAMDRPRQIARSMRRMVGEAWRAELNDALMIWQGPPLFDLAKNTGDLTAMCASAHADTVVVDSIKDAAIGLSDDEVGAGWNRARQKALAAGVEVLELHHQRKAQQGHKAPVAIDDVFGSTWITSGTGSVLVLDGAPGDPIVGLRHLKQPENEVGPLKVVHDAESGRSSVWHAADLAQVAQATPGGLTAVDAARVLFEVDKPSTAQKEKARRKLTRLTEQGVLKLLDPGDTGAKKAARWGAK